MLDLSDIAALLSEAPPPVAPPASFEVDGRLWDFSKRHLLGVINLSRDSWYSESIARSPDEAIEMGMRLIDQGAAAVDVGAESTLKHAALIEPVAQIQSLLPVVTGLVTAGVTVSVESYYPEVLDACGAAGARIFNLTGTRGADDCFDVAAKHDAAVILCYVAGETVRDVQTIDLEQDLGPYFTALTERAAEHGVTRCFIDPGLGFYYANLEDGRTRVRYQVDTLLKAYRLARLGFPILNILPHAPDFFGEEDRRAAEPFFSVLAMMFGSHVLRTHEVRTVARVRDLLESV